MGQGQSTGAKGSEGAKGDKGDKGDQGPLGPQGIQGIKGDQGEQGIRGDIGIQGNKGDKGDQGTQGIQGIQGPQGNKGDIGIQGNMGDKGDQGPLGPQGVGYNLDTRLNSIGRDNGDWFRIFGTPGAGTALYNGLSINDNRGLSVGEWRTDIPVGEIKTTGKICIGPKWCIVPEGDVLVFRDQTTGGDNRFAMFPGRGNGPATNFDGNNVKKDAYYRLLNQRDRSVAQNNNGTINWAREGNDGQWESFKFIDSASRGW